jgi:hypothetical protein
MTFDTEGKLRAWIMERADDFWVPKMLKKVERPEQLALIAVGLAFKRWQEEPQESGSLIRDIRDIETCGVERKLIAAMIFQLKKDLIEADQAQKNN